MAALHHAVSTEPGLIAPETELTEQGAAPATTTATREASASHSATATTLQSATNVEASVASKPRVRWSLQCLGWSILGTVLFIITVILIATSFVVVDMHQAALVYDSLHKELRDQHVLGPGRHFLGVSAVPLIYSTRVRTIEFITLCSGSSYDAPEVLENEGVGCWDECNQTGGLCPSFCGTGSCCSEGFEGDPAECAGGGCTDFHCCTATDAALASSAAAAADEEDAAANDTAADADESGRTRCSDVTWGTGEPEAASLEMWTSDGQWVTLEASFMYRLNRTELPLLYRKMKFDYEPLLIQMATAAIKDQSTRFDTVDFFSSRAAIRLAMLGAVSDVLRAVHVEVVSFQFRKLSVSSRWEGAIETKLLSAQQRRTVEYQQQSAVISADIAVVLAQADATVELEQAEARATASVLLAGVAAAVAHNVSRAEGAAFEGFRGRLNLSQPQLMQYAQVRRLVAPSGTLASGAPYSDEGAARKDASHLLIGVASGGSLSRDVPTLDVVHHRSPPVS